MDIVPGFWLKVKELAERGLIISIDKVWNELNQNNDELTVWCESNLKFGFFKDSSVAVSSYAQLSAWAYSRSSHYKPAALNEFLDAAEADAWLIAYACAHGNTIVTHETSSPNQKNKVKIPDACKPFGVTCVNTIEMFRVLVEGF